MGFGSDLCSEMKWRNNELETNKWRSGGGRWHGCIGKSGLAGRMGLGS